MHIIISIHFSLFWQHQKQLYCRVIFQALYCILHSFISSSNLSEDLKYLLYRESYMLNRGSLQTEVDCGRML